MTESKVQSGAVSEIGRNGDEATPLEARDLAHGPETVPAAPLRAVPVPDRPDLDLDEALLEDDRAAAGAFETPPSNGEYRGPVPVRRVAPGVAGEEIALSKTARLTAGARWIRGIQRVEITAVTETKVRFRELVDGEGNPSSDPRAIHTRGRAAFIRTGRPA